jgi:hypothetical protein
MASNARSFRKTFAGVVALLALVAPGSGFLAAAKGSDAKSEGADIQGKVFRADGKTAVSGAVVTAYLLDAGRTISSPPSRGNGEFELTGLPFGYADLYVETAEGVFAGNQVVNLAPGGKLAVSFQLSTYGERSPAWWSGREPKELPGSGKKPIGIAELRTKVRGREFWRSPGGIATLGAIGGGALLAIAAGSGGSSTAASPSTP